MKEGTPTPLHKTDKNKTDKKNSGKKKKKVSHEHNTTLKDLMTKNIISQYSGT